MMIFKIKFLCLIKLLTVFIFYTVREFVKWRFGRIETYFRHFIHDHFFKNRNESLYDSARFEALHLASEERVRRLFEGNPYFEDFLRGFPSPRNLSDSLDTL